MNKNKNNLIIYDFVSLKATQAGFEPATFGLEVQCPIQARLLGQLYLFFLLFD